MDLSFTEQQETLQKSARDFIKEKFPKEIVKELERSGGYSLEIWKEMAELGWTGLPFPEKYGGAGMTFLDLAILLEEMGRGCMPGPYFSAVVLGGFPILDTGTEEQKLKYLSELSSGETILTLALTEPGGDYYSSSIATNAVRNGDGWTINGTKLFVPDAHIADYLLCVASTEKTESDDGLTVFIVNAKDASISITLLKTMADNLCEVVFNETKVPQENILGGLNQGWGEIEKVTHRAAVARCCEMVGMAQQVLEMTFQYAKERKQFGHPIGSFQAIQHYCADMFVDAEGMRVSTYQAASMLSKGIPYDWEVAIAKGWAMQAVERIISLAHQIHGAIGVTMDYNLHYYTRRLKNSQLTFGNADYYRNIIAKKMEL